MYLLFATWIKNEQAHIPYASTLHVYDNATHNEWQGTQSILIINKNNLIKRHYSIKFKSAKFPEKFPDSMHINKLCPKYLQSFKKFLWSKEYCWQTVNYYSIYGKNFKFKRAWISRKKWNLNFLVICTFTECVLNTCKVWWNSVQWCKRSLPYIRMLFC